MAKPEMPEWELHLRQELATPYGRARLLCGGMRCSWRWAKASKAAMKYRLITWVNGEFRGEWARSDYAGPERRVLRRQVCRVHTPAERKELMQLPAASRVGYLNPDATFVMWCWDWPSVGALIRHLRREFVEITVAPARAPLDQLSEAED